MMNERQRRFCEHYAAGPNATEAAKAAGYSAKTAYSAGQRLLKNVEVQRYIWQLQDELAAGRIASMVQIRAFWSDTVRDAGAKLSDRLKASELLARAAGAFLHFRPDPDGGGVIATGEVDGSDVVIYVPQMLREEDCQATGGGRRWTKE